MINHQETRKRWELHQCNEETLWNPQLTLFTKMNDRKLFPKDQ
jgi:hypothetical protein